MSLYSRYKTSDSLEKSGIIMDLGYVQIRICRAGGANVAYTKRMEVLAKPHRRAIQANSLPRETAQEIAIRAYAETVITEWKTKKDDGKFYDGIETEDGSTVPFTVDNVVKALTDLPDLFNDIQEFAQNSSLFLQSNLEEDAKN